jgi:chromosome segregation ATPase
MSRLLIAALCLTLAAPVVVSFAPTPADAQVMAGRGAARSAERHRRPALSEREENRLYAAQDQVTDLQQQIEALETAGQTAGGLTTEQATQIASHRTQMAEAQSVVDRLEAKRARREGN